MTVLAAVITSLREYEGVKRGPVGKKGFSSPETQGLHLWRRGPLYKPIFFECRVEGICLGASAFQKTFKVVERQITDSSKVIGYSNASADFPVVERGREMRVPFDST